MQASSCLLLAAVTSLLACSSTSSGTTADAAAAFDAAPDAADAADAADASPPEENYDALFGKPKSAPTPDSLLGVWSGTMYVAGGGNLDARLKIAADSIVVAARCEGATMGVKMAAEVTAKRIRTLESFDLQAGNCFFAMRPRTLVPCTTDAPENCFALKDIELTFSAVSLIADSPSTDTFTKLSD